MCQTCDTTKRCAHCDAKLSYTKHALLSGHVSALLKLHRAVLHYGRNAIHIRNEMADCPGAPFQLTRDEWSNFSKLRYHGLAAKTDRLGYWLLTTRGTQFLKREITLPETVLTFRNRVVGHEGRTMGINHFRPLIPEFDRLTYSEEKVSPRTTQPLFQ